MKPNIKKLLEPKDFEPSFKNWTVKGAINPSAVRLPNKKIMLMVRVSESVKNQKTGLNCPTIVSTESTKIRYENIPQNKILKKGKRVIYLKDGLCRLPTISHFRKVILDETGYEIESIDKKPSFVGRPNESEYGVEDSRISKIGNMYYMAYVGVSMDKGVSSYLAKSKDLKNWKRLGIIFREQNKDVVLFPEKIKNKYIALNRPESTFEFTKPSIWISYSPDLTYWGEGDSLIRPRKDSWEEERIGAGPPPIKTEEGWLLIYHGMRNVKKSGVYSVGAVLLDFKNPKKILARTSANKPLITPTEKFEKSGFINNVVFPTALIPDLEGDNFLLYSGGGDSISSVRKLKLKSVLKSLN